MGKKVQFARELTDVTKAYTAEVRCKNFEATTWSLTLFAK
jgi:hypothetical protein